VCPLSGLERDPWPADGDIWLCKVVSVVFFVRGLEYPVMSIMDDRFVSELRNEFREVRDLTNGEKELS
jgi:hypothetical protein